MIRSRFFILVVFAALLGVSVICLNKGADAQRQGTPRYDPSTVQTITGSVEEVQEIAGMGRRGAGIHLRVKTDSATVEVHVGPSWFVSKEGFKFEKGDQVEIIGSKVKFDDSDVIIAREVKKGDKTLTLRDEKGYPAWSRGPRM